MATRAIVPAVASCAPSCHTQHGWWALGSVVGSTPHGPYDTDFGPYASAWAIGVVLRSLAQLRNATAEKLTPLIFERMDESLVLILDMLGMPLEDGVITSKTSPHPSRSQWPPAAIDAYRTRLVQDGCVRFAFSRSSSSPCGIINPSLRRDLCPFVNIYTRGCHARLPPSTPTPQGRQTTSRALTERFISA